MTKRCQECGYDISFDSAHHCSPLGAFYVKDALTDQPQEISHTINHEEALDLAYIKRNESNLARCYIDLNDRIPDVGEAIFVSAPTETELSETELGEFDRLHIRTNGMRRYSIWNEIEKSAAWTAWQAARQARGQVREGWKLVPIEATGEMLNEFNIFAQCEGEIERGYRAMLDAAPKE